MTSFGHQNTSVATTYLLPIATSRRVWQPWSLHSPLHGFGFSSCLRHPTLFRPMCPRLVGRKLVVLLPLAASDTYMHLESGRLVRQHPQEHRGVDRIVQPVCPCSPPARGRSSASRARHKYRPWPCGRWSRVAKLSGSSLSRSSGFVVSTSLSTSTLRFCVQ
jgi:hypothetical protein